MKLVNALKSTAYNSTILTDLARENKKNRLFSVILSCMTSENVDISKYLDNGKVKVWPSKTKFREAIRNYLATKIERKRIYSEKEINVLLNNNLTFGDPAFFRRELCDHGLIFRDKYGFQYWKK